MINTRSIPAQGVSVAALFMRQVYLWMATGLGITAFVAWQVAASEVMRSLVFSSMFVVVALFFAQLGLVFALNSAIQRMSAFTATALFVLYSALTGMTLSSIFLVYPIGNIVNAFVVSAGTFLAMSIYGWVTKRDLTSMGSFLMMGVFGLFIAIVVNLFLQSAMMDFIICCAGVLIFTGLTAWDTQRIKEFGAAAPLNDSTAVRRGVILGALTLYIDFINIFIFMLRLMGGNRD